MHALYAQLGLSGSAVYFGNSLADWVDALAIGLLTFVALILVRRQVLVRTGRLLGMDLPRSVRLVIDIVSTTRRFVLLAVSLLVGLKFLDLGLHVEHRLDAFIATLVLLQIGIWLSAVVRFYLDTQALDTSNRSVQSVVTIARFLANMSIWSLVLLLALDNMGFQVKPLLAGLGIGGIAVALAVQNVLGDLLASVAIALDKPFEVGDSLTLDGGYIGTVETIGIKSTRLTSNTGEQIVLSNAELVKTRIRNFGRLRERRAIMRFGIAYNNKAHCLAEIPRLLSLAVSHHQIARFERAHCVGFSPAAMDFEATYMVMSADYTVFLDVQHAINLEFASSLEAGGIVFAAAQPLATLKL
jgi:small-conductance mechanosensitive channel